MSKPESVLEVVRTEELTPRLKRIIFGGAGFEDYLAHDIDATDKYVKLVFTDAEGEQRLRTYTIRWVDTEARELAIDFVTHDRGLAGPWAIRAVAGDMLLARGPGGAYRPNPEVDHHLFVGDESSVPAIAASLEVLGENDTATVFCEVDDAASQVLMSSRASVEFIWLHRDGAAPGATTLLDDAVRAWTIPQGRVAAFVHGESALLKTVRPYLLDGRVERQDMSVSAYWRRGEDEEGFRVWKSGQSEAIIRPGA